MDNDINQQPQPKHSPRVLAGLVLLVFGGIMLLKQMNIFFFPHDLELWPLWLVFAGLYFGARSNFHKPSSIILITIGIILLITNNVHGAEDFIWPVGIIAFGIWMILRPRNPYNNNYNKDYWKQKYEHKWDWRFHTGDPAANPPPAPGAPYTNYTEVPPPGAQGKPFGDDYLDAVSVFGGVKKMILSKDFKGGEIVNVFGGAELDFTHADINGTVVIDITQIFGGVKMIVPSNWQVVSDIAAVFASVDDKRIKSTAPQNSDKILLLKGVSIFAGIDIRSF